MMWLSPRVLSLVLALLIALITTSFLAFVEGVNKSMLFVVATSTSLTSFFLFLYTIDFIVFREVNKMYRTIQKLKLRDFDMEPRKRVLHKSNPLKTLNDEIFGYVSKKQKEIDQLKKQEAFRREFLADVSHEFKTPIFAAQGFIHTLLDGAIEDDRVRERFLQKAARNLDNLDVLVRDLLVLSQMETGDITMHLAKVDISALTWGIFSSLENIAAAKRIGLKLKPDIQEPIWVHADHNRISQVLLNLIENAIKYGHEGGKVIVHFSVGKKFVEISIRDNGPGIPNEHLSRIFERFYRVDKSRSKEIGGTGLGLAIVKHILQGHHTKISVESKQDKGTIFTFKLAKFEDTKEQQTETIPL